ncbi:hypothetical protein J8273_3413 [Carpediemonas membranifera]|uniref:rRNA-processing protein FYV7 n=1 Tax=Carpediemonas membranifera TaxID=201153 RepID=A0A8J6E9F8_9EUKA|nr:hypothetical protein J8273_3413 [Carpediemonas membranifera]|eukprot:KAG9393280.1 hypothetical protein J8273_3413 [Carpediemonas membranifera]
MDHQKRKGKVTYSKNLNHAYQDKIRKRKETARDQSISLMKYRREHGGRRENYLEQVKYRHAYADAATSGVQDDEEFKKNFKTEGRFKMPQSKHKAPKEVKKSTARPPAKSDPLFRAKKEAERTKGDRERAKEQRDQENVEIEGRKQEYKKHRTAEQKKMAARNARGQPRLGSRMEVMLGRIKRRIDADDDDMAQ